MHDYRLFDQVVAQTITQYLQEADKEGYICISIPEGMTDTLKYFLEVVRITMQLTDKKVYIDVDFWRYVWYKLRYHKLLRDIKRSVHERKHIDLIQIMQNIDHNCETDSVVVLPEIYQVYYSKDKDLCDY